MAKTGKPRSPWMSAKKGGRSHLPLAAAAAVAVALIFGVQWYLSSRVPEGKPSAQMPPPKMSRASRAASEISEQREAAAAADRYHGGEWLGLVRNLPDCLSKQKELMTAPVDWPGFHALCIEAVDSASVRVLMHTRSARDGAHPGAPLDGGPDGMRVLVASAAAGSDLAEALVAALQGELLGGEFQSIDQTISDSDYDFPPNPWRLFTTAGGVVSAGSDLQHLGAGAAVWLFTGGQFIWPGVRLQLVESGGATPL